MAKVFFILVSLFLVSTELLAEDPAVEEKLREVNANVLSPYCPGRLLQDCPSGAAGDLKDEIREMLKEGKSVEEVYDELYLRFGDSVKAAPDSSGFGMLAWLGPFIFLAIGLLVYYFWVRAHQDRESSSN